MQRNILKDVILKLGKLNQPVVTSYQLGVLIWLHFHTVSLQSPPSNIQPSYPEDREFPKTLSNLVDLGIIEESKAFPNNSVYDILGKDRSSPEEIVCTIDPFAYISHLDAMSHHGLTDRIPQMLFVCSPAPSKWHDFAIKKMDKDLGPDLSLYSWNKFPKLVRIHLNKINGRPVHRHSSIHLGAFKTVKHRMLRVSTIGRTFLDMLRKPDLCGGIHHVIDVFREHGELYFKLIVDEIDRHGNQIDKIRAGYILEEVCGLHSEAIERWRQYAQRGGSRKLDSSGEYSPSYSERWCLSLNTD